MAHFIQSGWYRKRVLPLRIRRAFRLRISVMHVDIWSSIDEQLSDVVQQHGTWFLFLIT